MTNALYAPSLPNHRRLDIPTVRDKRQIPERVNGNQDKQKKKEDERGVSGDGKQNGDHSTLGQVI